MKAIQMVGRRFGRLIVKRRADTMSEKIRFECQCDCGSNAIVRGELLRRGETKSCGCLSVETTNARNRTHGMTKTATWQSWNSMLRRCRDPKRWQYKYYGARGITVCARWSSFENFLADMGERPAGTTLDRIDSNGHYEPGNCRWATPVEQRNNRRD